MNQTYYVILSKCIITTHITCNYSLSNSKLVLRVKLKLTSILNPQEIIRVSHCHTQVPSLLSHVGMNKFRQSTPFAIHENIGAVLIRQVTRSPANGIAERVLAESNEKVTNRVEYRNLACSPVRDNSSSKIQKFSVERSRS
ncbi:hypothetical protein AVEN_175518-1 [Araneus ventricosus]|uniref:Uncharacterized protein n=1 Tax=Araneus ventricosus TaxID=182803 RepID=A0A4Y2CPH7_ARAVE|nr:hypothetical protein AVEN_175518-1 [Araneus ventricosus]